MSYSSPTTTTPFCPIYDDCTCLAKRWTHQLSLWFRISNGKTGILFSFIIHNFSGKRRSCESQPWFWLFQKNIASTYHSQIPNPLADGNKLGKLFPHYLDSCSPPQQKEVLSESSVLEKLSTLIMLWCHVRTRWQNVLEGFQTLKLSFIHVLGK